MIQNNSRPLWFVTRVMLAVLALPFGTRAQERVGNATAGISIVPPSGWHVTSMQDVMNNRSQLRLPDQREHRILSWTWLVPRGSFMFLIGMSGATDGDDVCQAEFAAALKSIAIDK